MHGHAHDDYAGQPPPFGDTGAERLKQEAGSIGTLVSGVVSDLQDLFRAQACQRGGAVVHYRFWNS